MPRRSVVRSVPSPVTLLAAVLLLVVALGSVPAAASAREAAAPTAPEPISHLDLVDVGLGTGGYLLTVVWRAGAGTSGYHVRARAADGTVLDAATVTTTRWQPELDARAGDEIVVRVTPYAGRVRGPASTLGTTLPDLTPPTGVFALSRSHRDVTVTWTALSDDVSRSSGIRRSVRWGDGTARQPWRSGRSLTHRYPGPGHWHPRVRLVDAAGNAATVPAGAVVIGDHTPPTGAFSASPTLGWADLTEVGLTQLALHDNASAATGIGRTVDWGDGSSTPWPAGEPVAHVYGTDGVFTPAVQLVDEAGNRRTVPADPVTINRDAAAPTVRMWRPSTHRASVSSWRVLYGRAADAGAGVALVRVQVVQQRPAGWYGYHPGDGAWVAAADRRDAWRHARTALVLPTRTGRWLCPVRPLRQGLLVVRVTARDNVGNTSARLEHRRRLTRP